MASQSSEQTVETAIAARQGAINDAIDAKLDRGDPVRLYDASLGIVTAGGKRLRPAMLLLVAEALADEGTEPPEYDAFPTLDGALIDVMAPAVSIEIIHSFTLIHDDIMDDDDMRRGVPAVHREYDTPTAILAGDTLYSKAFEIVLQSGAPADRTLEAVELLAQTCTHICEGQAMDVGFETCSGVELDAYREMIELKTAVLYAAAAAMPAIVCGADTETVESLYRYGICVGQAFQIQDDVLDLTTDSDTLGKRRGSDLLEGKRTVITLHARENGVDVDGLLDTDSSEAVTEAAIDDAVGTLEDAGSIEFAREMAQELVAEGKRHLEVLPENEARATLAAVADYLIEREH